MIRVLIERYLSLWMWFLIQQGNGPMTKLEEDGSGSFM